MRRPNSISHSLCLLSSSLSHCSRSSSCIIRQPAAIAGLRSSRRDTVVDVLQRGSGARFGQQLGEGRRGSADVVRAVEAPRGQGQRRAAPYEEAAVLFAQRRQRAPSFQILRRSRRSFAVNGCIEWPVATSTSGGCTGQRVACVALGQ
ncbi:hypothetical protein AAHA92_22472 [Salvia divinorum]|uniref:Secreted protein n=1 Tax=Salvia divinorum TaxID=28513 RepID=A0ABD1GNS6_SALDI